MHTDAKDRVVATAYMLTPCKQNLNPFNATIELGSFYAGKFLENMWHLLLNELNKRHFIEKHVSYKFVFVKVSNSIF